MSCRPSGARQLHIALAQRAIGRIERQRLLDHIEGPRGIAQFVLPQMPSAEAPPAAGPRVCSSSMVK